MISDLLLVEPLLKEAIRSVTHLVLAPERKRSFLFSFSLRVRIRGRIYTIYILKASDGGKMMPEPAFSKRSINHLAGAASSDEDTKSKYDRGRASIRILDSNLTRCNIPASPDSSLLGLFCFCLCFLLY